MLVLYNKQLIIRNQKKLNSMNHLRIYKKFLKNTRNQKKQKNRKIKRKNKDKITNINVLYVRKNIKLQTRAFEPVGKLSIL